MFYFLPSYRLHSYFRQQSVLLRVPRCLFDWKSSSTVTATSDELGGLRYWTILGNISQLPKPGKFLLLYQEKVLWFWMPWLRQPRKPGLTPTKNTAVHTNSKVWTISFWPAPSQIECFYVDMILCHKCRHTYLIRWETSINQ